MISTQVSTADADAARLRDACAPGTFGRAYGAFMGRHGFDADDRSPVTLVDDEELAYVLLRYRQVHDYWHVLFGLPPSIPPTSSAQSSSVSAHGYGSGTRSKSSFQLRALLLPRKATTLRPRG